MPKLYIHTIDYCSAFKKEKIPSPAMTWMNVVDLMQSKRSQSQKDTYMRYLKRAPALEQKVEEWSQGLRGRENGELMFNKCRVCKMKSSRDPFHNTRLIVNIVMFSFR